MRLLLDTQAFIWFVENDKNLPDKLKIVLENINNHILVRIASLWEMTIKMSLGKLQLSGDIDSMITKLFANGFELLPIQTEHIIKLATLEFFHKDPFDSIIISQTICEDLQIISSDEIFDKYNFNRIWK